MEIRRAVERMPSVFTLRERTILKDRFGLSGDEPMTLADAAKKNGVTKARLRQLEQKAMATVMSVLQDSEPTPVHPGSLRDWFAGLAMQGYVATYRSGDGAQFGVSCDEVEADATEIADMSYVIADKMMERRANASNPPGQVPEPPPASQSAGTTPTRYPLSTS